MPGRKINIIPVLQTEILRINRLIFKNNITVWGEIN